MVEAGPKARRVFHITTCAQWADALVAGEYMGDALVSDGFIHASTADQWPAVRSRLFEGRADLVLLEVDLDQYPHEVRWENLEGGSELFPHLYGPVETLAVVSARVLAQA